MRRDGRCNHWSTCHRSSHVQLAYADHSSTSQLKCKRTRFSIIRPVDSIIRHVDSIIRHVDSIASNILLESILWRSLKCKLKFSLEMPRKCINSSDSFCYICGEFTTVDRKNSISVFTKRCYFAYFGCKLGDQDKPWAPHIVCKKMC